MSHISSFGRTLSAAAFAVAALTVSAGPTFAAQPSPAGVSKPGYMPQARALLKTQEEQRSFRVQQQVDDRSPRKDCDRAGYRYMSTPNYDVPMLCR